ncbi:MAG: HAMP domain-containing histidine kinase [Micropruina sp.]|nr:HAMP domain-containing histidine kinase [Micropruina sp.]
MNRLSVRLVLSHVLVAVVGGLTTFLVVRALAPALFDESLRHNPAPGSGRFGGGPNQALRDQFATAVDQSLLVGTLIGALVAAVLGALLAQRVIRQLRTMRRATRAMAGGRYDVTVALPREVELASLAEDVNTLGSALARTEERRVRLLGEVAHELRTPLTVIDGYVEAMMDGILPTTPTELGPVSDEVRRLRRLSEDLSSLSKAEEGRLDLRRTTLDLRELIVGAAERLRPQVADAGITLVIEAGDDPLIASADPDRIAQVLTNLVGNALRATDAGGSVTIHCSAAAGMAAISVTDTGVGLAAAELDRVFERFYRVRGRRTAGEAGSGIGLTIAQDIANAHGGILTASSPGLGLGATFTLALPLS